MRSWIAVLSCSSLLALGLAAAAPAPASQAPKTETYTVDNSHSMALFRVKHLGVSNFYGHFKDMSGAFTLDPEDAGNSSVSIEVKTASIDTHDAKRDQHLMSPDFFSAKEFPVLSFK